MTRFKDQAVALIGQFLAQEIPAREFCPRYEHLWNFERESADLTPKEAALFEELFTATGWFTDVPEDLAANKRFKAEPEIREKARRTLASLDVHQ